MEVSALTRFMMAIGMGGPDVSCVQAVTIEVINRGPHAFIEARPRQVRFALLLSIASSNDGAQDNAMVLLVVRRMLMLAVSLLAHS